MPTEVFLSHSSNDRIFVERLADVLRAHGVPYWYSETNIVGARMWHDEIGAALNREASPDPWTKEVRYYDYRLTELHWYEAHGIGRREVKRKRYLD